MHVYKTNPRLHLIILHLTLMLALLGGLWAAAPAQNVLAAATWAVTSSADGTANAANCPGAGCRLRDAIAAAASGDTITFAAALSGQTITLNSGTLSIDKNLTIDGSSLASSVSISGNNAVRVFHVTSTVSDATLKALVITNGSIPGDKGGGIENDGTLSVRSSTLSANTAELGGAIYNSSTLTMDNSTLSANSASAYGGAIYNFHDATLTVENNTLDNNSAVTLGGGIYNRGMLTLNNSTLSGNVTHLNGGGIFNWGTLTVKNTTFTGNSSTSSDGGGIYNDGGTLTVDNSTFSTNSAVHYGGGIASKDTLKLNNSTFSANSADHGGAVVINSSLSYTNNLFAGSVSDSDCYKIGGTVSGTHNLAQVDAPTGYTCGTSGTNYTTGDPQLGALADNGGPTQTLALLPGSPALDAGDVATCTDVSGAGGIDQRGMPRGAAGKCDIGAYEAGSAYAALTVDLANSTPADAAILAVGPASLKLLFNRPADPLTGSAAANYLLVGAGPDGSFETQTCKAGQAGDDTSVAVNSASYDDTTSSTTLAVNGGAPLPNASYRLFICGTTSIYDQVGLKLNNGLSDSRLSFRVGVPTPGGSGGSSSLPATGFAPGVVSVLPAQPAQQDYRDEGGLTLEIPDLGVRADVVGVPQGQGWNVSWLGRRVGYLEGTAYPTLAGNSVLAGHATDADGLPGIFAGLGTLRYGQRLVLHAWGQTFTYEVRTVNDWVAPNDTRLLTRHEAYPWLTLVTCRGFNQKSGAYAWRTVVRAVLVKAGP